MRRSMRDKRWFCTKENQIIDVNMMRCFVLHEVKDRGEEYYLVTGEFEDSRIDVIAAKFGDKLKAAQYLQSIYLFLQSRDGK